MCTASLPPRTRHLEDEKKKHCRVFRRIEREKTVCCIRQDQAQANPSLDLINIHLLATCLIVIALTTVLIELEIAVAIALLAVSICLIDLGALG